MFYTGGVIGNTEVFGTSIHGSSPCRVDKNKIGKIGKLKKDKLCLKK